MKRLLGGCLVLCFVVVAAAVVVLALIPLYTPAKNVTVYQPAAGRDYPYLTRNEELFFYV